MRKYPDFLCKEINIKRMREVIRMKREMKWKGLRAVLCSMAAMLLCMALPLTAYAYTPRNHPSSLVSPDGQGWTLYDPLPEADYVNKPASFWEPVAEHGKYVNTGQPLDLIADKAGLGEHVYKYKRYGEIPIYAWRLSHPDASCVQANAHSDEFHGVDTSVPSICGLSYWSGWIPVCANCGEYIVPGLHYAKTSSVQTLDVYDMGMFYYYKCPHNGHLEQGLDYDYHECDALSANRYMVVYEKNYYSAKGEMDPSFHMYCNATHFEGEEVVPDKYLHKNTYTRSGYEFKGWATTPDGEVVYEDQAEIYNLTDKNYDKDTGEGVVYLYAVWEKSTSTLIVDAEGGVYNDTKGVWDASSTTRTYADINFGTKLAILESNLTPPEGYSVVFDEKGGSAVSDVKTKKEFVSWAMSDPFGGRFQENIYSFCGPNGTVDRLTAVYDNGKITLPTTNKDGSNFGGWYKDPEYKEFVGFGGDEYTPREDTILYAKWTDLTLYAEPKTDAGVAGGKGYVYLKWNQKDDTDKVFRLYRKPTGTDDSAYQEIISANADGSSFTVNESFDYKGSAQTYVIPYTGFYNFDVYGAQGGNYGTYKGGKGGQVTGKVWLKKGDKLTITVGGQNGYNGGGDATAYGNGGGMTSITLNDTTTLFVAGGGGGASPAFNGGNGGKTESNRADKSSGASGMAGGGGGYKGGNAGEEIYHNHVNMGCVKHVHQGDTVNGGLCYKGEVKDGCDGSFTIEHSKYWRCEICGMSMGTEAYKSGGEAAHAASGCWYSLGYVSHWKCDVCGTNGRKGEEHNVMTTVYTLNCDKEWLCGKTEGDVESSKAAYGGSSYVSGKATTYTMNAGVQSGNGKVVITSESVGYLSDYAANDLTANDYAAPDAIIVDADNAKIEADGKNTVLVSWDINEHKKTKDNGTFYDHLCKSYAPGSSVVACVSNMTTVEVKTGITQYYYIYDKNATTTVTKSNKQGSVPVSNPSLRVNVFLEEVNYLHIAAIDQAGNLGPTSHIGISAAEGDPGFGAINWGVITEPVYISSVVGSSDYKSVYNDGGKIYVKADGRTPFKLGYIAKLNGYARNNYQVDHLYFDVNKSGSTNTQEFMTQIPHTDASVHGSVAIPSDGLRRSASGTSLMKDALNSGASKSNYAVDVSFYQAFTVPSSLHGSSLRINPRAGAEYTALDGWMDIMYSDATLDYANGLTIWPDGKAPDIYGTEQLEAIDSYDRNAGVILTFSANDTDSGLKDFYIKVQNTDNYAAQTYYADATGVVKIPVDGSSVLFFGDVNFELVATDNVGNVNRLTYGAWNFDLDASLSKTGVLPRGEGVVLNFVTTGYAERVEVVWPGEFEDTLPTIFDYTAMPEFAKTEAVPFILPLTGVENEYDIIVRAYKDGRVIEEVLTIQVSGSILDDVRVRIR